MSIYSPYRRFFRSIAVGVALIALYLVVRAVTSPFLDVERKQHDFTQRGPDVLPEYRQEAARWFPGFPWVANAANHFRDNGQYLLCNQLDLISDGRSVVAKPLAMMWRSNPADKDEVPVTIVADSAQLNSTKKFLNSDSSFGRITSGTIYGRVRIDGPRGLRITGELFNLSEDSMMLWSNNRVDFVWEGHSGYATKGVEIHLQGSNGSEAGLTDVSDVSTFKLLGQVVCNVSMPESRKGEDPLNLKIQAPGGFSFDVAMKTATFSGLRRAGPTDSLKAKDEVWVRHPNPGGVAEDHLVCPELKLQFRNEISAEDGTPIEGTMQLEHVMAWGRKVVVLSEANDLRLYANQLQYFLDERRFDIRNTGTSGISQKVTVRRGETSLEVPHVQIRHAADGTLQRIECNGEGTIKSSVESLAAKKPAMAFDSTVQKEEPLALNATWTRSMVVQLAADGVSRLLKLEGSASVAEESRKFRLTGESIAMRLAGSTQKVADPNDAAAPASGSDSKGSPASFDFSDLRPEVLTAVGNVSLSSPQGDGTLRDKLTVRFEPMAASASDSDGPVKTVSASTKDNPFGITKGEDGEAEIGESLAFVSDTLDAVIRVGEDNAMEFEDLWLEGDVEVIRQGTKESEGFTAKGNQLHASSGNGNQREIELFGDPARIIRDGDTGNLEGTRIDFKELGRSAQVKGSGRIRFITDRTFEGKKLETPMPIDIYWSEYMDFQKQSAKFVGSIRVVMSDGATQDVELLCAGLTVYFANDVSLGPKEADGGFATFSESGGSAADEKGQIERIECHSKVTLKAEQSVDSALVARYDAAFADLTLNLQTGDFHATGPGKLESISPDKDGKLQGASPAAARANSPAQTSETSFVYTQTEFIGELSGNMHSKTASLSQNVVALIAPVRRVDEKIDIRNVPIEQLPERAGILRAEHLTISGIDEPEDTPDSFAMVAKQNAGLWSQSISAGADVITYDHSKQQFIMRADGNGQVTVNHRAGQGSRYSQFTGNRFEYYRRTNQLKGDQIRGLDVTN